MSEFIAKRNRVQKLSADIAQLRRALCFVRYHVLQKINNLDSYLLAPSNTVHVINEIKTVRIIKKFFFFSKLELFVLYEQIAGFVCYPSNYYEAK